MPSDDELLKSKIISAKIKILETRASGIELRIDDAWRAVANINVVPVHRISTKDQNAKEETARRWLNCATQSGVISPTSTCLMAPVTRSSYKLGWARVQVSAEAQISALTDDQGHLEFIALSEDESRLCGITTEEYEYWVVSLSLRD